MALLCEFTLFNDTACQVPDMFCASTSTYTRNKVTINMALTFMISYVMIHLAKVTYTIVFGIHIVNSKCQICYTLLRSVKSNNISTNVGSIQPHLNYYAKTNYIK